MTLTAPMKSKLGGQPVDYEAHERLKGQDPRSVSLDDFASLGFAKRPLLDVIRGNCVECQGGDASEVRRCAATACPFWPYRLHCDPFRTPISDELRATRAKHLNAARKSPNRSSFSDAQQLPGMEVAGE
jgi:hypothetical protein